MCESTWRAFCSSQRKLNWLLEIAATDTSGGGGKA